MIKLAQEKLDVLFKKRSNIFNWRGQFTPEFVEYLIDNFANEDMVIVDPFSGSGTVLSEAARKGIKCFGLEINPTAYYMSRFFEFSNYTKTQREEYMYSLEAKILPLIESLDVAIPLYQKKKEYRESYYNLLTLAKDMRNIVAKEDWIFILNLLFLSEKDKKMNLRDSILKNFSNLKNVLYALPYSNKKISSYLADARSINSSCIENVDLIITSPPYINVFNYHQNYRGIIEMFDYDILRIANSEFGSNRKNRGNRFKTVMQYVLDMGEALVEFTKVMKVGAKMILVVGCQSNVRGTIFYNSQIILDIFSMMNCFNVLAIHDRAFNNKFGETIKEDVLIVEKKNNISSECFNFNLIGVSHLQKALEYCSEETKDDILKVINDNTICSSPKLKL